MSRPVVVCGFLVLVAVSGFGRDATEPAKPADKATPASPVEVLRTRRDFQELNDPNFTIGQLLAALTTRQEVPFSVNQAALRAEGMSDALNLRVLNEESPNPVPAAKNVPIESYLRTVLSRTESLSKLTFVPRKDHIELTTRNALIREIWGDHPGPYLPLVNAAFDKKPLEEVLKDLAEQTEYNIVLDARAGDKGKTAVTARFANTPLDTAAEFLADMADLRTVIRDNVIYVTTRENALRWAPKQQVDPETGGFVTPVGRIGRGVRGIEPPADAPIQ